MDYEINCSQTIFMDIYHYSIGAQEERVLFECKGRFQENYSQYVVYILHCKHIPHKVVKIYRQMPLIHCIQRISKFFNHHTKQYDKEDRLDDVLPYQSPQTLSVQDEETSSTTSKENEYLIVDHSEHSHETIEEENDTDNTDDVQNESKSSITILASGIFPRCPTTSTLSKNSIIQSILDSTHAINQDIDYSNDCFTEILVDSDISADESFCSIDRQVPPTPPINRFDNTEVSSTSYRVPHDRRHRTRPYHPRAIRRLASNPQKATSTTNQRKIQHYLYEFKHLTHRISRLYKKIDRILDCHPSICKSES